MLHEKREYKFRVSSRTEGVKKLNNKPHEPSRIHVTLDFRLLLLCVVSCSECRLPG